MNFRLFSLSLLFVSALLPFAASSTPSASAECVMVDTSVQTAIHGSQNPAQQNNNVDMVSQEPCDGNTVVHAGAQTAVTPGDVTQNRTSSEQVRGAAGNGTGVGSSTIKIPVSVQTNVYSPGLDPNFLSNLRGDNAPHH